MVDVSRWLAEQGLGHHAEAFARNGIGADILRDLTDADLKELGLNLGDRKRLLKAIAARDAVSGRDRLERTDPTPPVAHRDAERRQLTVMFVDLVGSTELAARLDPEDMSGLIRGYQNAVAGEITRFEGHIAKYMGDGVLAYFGWPRAHEDEAERAVRAGLAIVEAAGYLREPGGEPLAVRIGIATGPVVVGELIGEGTAQEQAVVGETPNVAARLQALAGPGGIVISAQTRRLVGGLFELADLGPQHLKGFAEPVRAWRVAGIGAAESRFEAMHAAGLTPLVGRAHELGLLLDRWELARSGEGQVVLLSGEPGIGKSRLIRELRARLEGERYTWLGHYCSPYHLNSALHPVIDLLNRAARFERDEAADSRLRKLEAVLARGTSWLDEAVPLIAALLGIETGQRYPRLELTPERQKRRIFEALLGQLEGLSEQAPVLALHEDLHWADPSTLELLGMVVDRVGRLPVLAVLTFRPEFTAPWTGYPHVTSLTLGRLGQSQGARMVERLIGSKPLPAEVLEQILAKTDGVPLFVEELTRTVLESGVVADAGDRFELAGSLPPLAIPATLHDSLMARLDRLTRVKEVAQIGAVIGREFSQELLVAVAPLFADRLGEALEELVDSGLVFRLGAPPEARYSFKHALVQDAAYASLLKSRRRQLHGRIAQTLTERFPNAANAQPEVVAYHFTEAALAEPAIDYWLKAGELAIRRSAYTEAISHIRTGLVLVDGMRQGLQRDRYELALQTALGPALMATKGWSAREVEHVYLRARELCERLGDKAQLFRIMRGLFAFYLVRSELRTARVVAEQLLALAEEACEPALLLEAHRALGQALCNIGEFGRAHAHLRQGLDLYGSGEHGAHAFVYGYDPGVTGRSNAAWALWYLGYPDRAVKAVTDALALAHELGHAFSLAYALGYAAWLHRFRREARESAEYAARLIHLSRKHGFEQWLAWGTILSASAAAMHRPQEDSATRMREGLAAHSATGAALWQSCFLCMLAEARAGKGQTKEALRLLAEALETAESSGEGFYVAELHRLKGELMIRASGGHGSEAEASFRRAASIGRDQVAKSLELRAATSLARLWAEQGRRVGARDALAPVYGWFSEGFDTPDLIEAKALLDELA